MRFQDRTQNLSEIIEFLKNEKLISDAQIKAIKQGSDFCKEVQNILHLLQGNEKLQLLEYEWNILPTEHIKILIVTDRAQRDFRFDE
jgi:hypothetical protein